MTWQLRREKNLRKEESRLREEQPAICFGRLVVNDNRRRAQRDENQDKAQTTDDGNDAQSCYINTSGIKKIVIKKTHFFF